MSWFASFGSASSSPSRSKLGANVSKIGANVSKNGPKSGTAAPASNQPLSHVMYGSSAKSLASQSRSASSAAQQKQSSLLAADSGRNERIHPTQLHQVHHHHHHHHHNSLGGKSQLERQMSNHGSLLPPSAAVSSSSAASSSSASSSAAVSAAVSSAAVLQAASHQTSQTSKQLKKDDGGVQMNGGAHVDGDSGMGQLDHLSDDDGDEHDKYKKNRRQVMFIATLLCLWYMAACIGTIVNKRIMKVFAYPGSLTFIHLITGATLDALILRMRGMLVLNMKRDKLFTLIRACLPVAFALTFAKTFTYVSYGKVPASLTHTVKASSPVFSVIVTYVQKRRLPRPRVLLSLVPVTLGVTLAAVNELDFVFLGFLAALLSTLLSVLHSMVTKRALTRLSIEPIVFHMWTSLTAVILLIPYLLWYDSYGIMQLMGFFGGSGSGVGAAGADASLSYATADALLDAADSGSTAAAAAAAATAAAAQKAAAAAAAARTGFPFGLVVVSVLCHSVQNVTSIYVLRLVNVLSHQVANTLKRLVVIVGSVMYFHNPVTANNAAGMGLALVGFLMYGVFQKAGVGGGRSSSSAARLRGSHSGNIPMSAVLTDVDTAEAAAIINSRSSAGSSVPSVAIRLNSTKFS
eukprot:TRINITY_DN65566_c9_g1_i1.p1 TRINITY_DN65566_c9_g1~~TRINITY_DN65566_c9_g1_i1.p1  ORF type:complete len:633 (+),score=275.07 TRINITY_DN65566_c9_g1_i1:14-1912(+)